MKKLAMNLLKTADEKLRNIGRNQSSTTVQTQNFTFYKNQPKREGDSQAQQSPQQLQHQQHQQHDAGETTPTTTAEKQVPEAVGEEMAERVIIRQGRRDRNGVRPNDETERREVKRRSKSEAPARRIRQSMDERENGRKQTFDGGGRARTLHESSDSESSGRDVRQITGCVGVESESDSDPKRWTKNPLVVRRTKRSGRPKQDENRFSGSENGLVAKNRDSWVYLGNEDGSSEGGGNSSSKDGGGSKKGSKYQKLEEMRRKRMNMSVTSDEENTPASRISRLRQRALQGGLGDQPRIGSAAQSVDSVQWQEKQHQQQHHHHQSANFPLPETNARKFPETNQEKEVTFIPVPDRPKYGPRATSLNQPQSSGAVSYIPQKQNLEPAVPKPRLSTNRVDPVVTKMATSLSENSRNFGQQSVYSQQKQSSILSSETHKQAPARPPPPNLTGARQSFYTIPEPNSSQTTRAVHNSSPEVAVRRFTTQTRVPSADSILNPNPKPGVGITTSGQPITFSNNLRQIQARGSPTPNQELFQSINSSRSPSQFNEVVELRLKTSREDRPSPSQRALARPLTKSKTFDHSDDSLDELIVSNIQYLDSEIDKKSKRNSVTQVSRSSSLPDPRRMSSHVSSVPSLHDQPSFQVQASTSIQFHVSLPTEAFQSGSNLQAPLIHIAPSNAQDYDSEYSYDSNLRSQPDVVPRKFSYDSHSRKLQVSEYFDRDDMSKSDTQLNAQIVIPSYLGNSLHPDLAYARGCVSDINLRSEPGQNLLHPPQADRGMFSDVEYDIEVSERVKKWETFMKDSQQTADKKNINLTPIQEHSESDALMLPSEVRKSVLLRKHEHLPHHKELSYIPASRSRPFSSDTSLNKYGESGDHKQFPYPSTGHGFLDDIEDSELVPRLGVQSQSVTSLYLTPVTLRPEKTFMSAGELRKQMLANRQHALPTGPVQATYQPHQFQISDNQSQAQTDMATRKGTFSMGDPGKKGFRDHAALNEMANFKTDTVVNLQRRFDTDSANVTSEDDQRSVSTASAKLSQQSRESPSLKDGEPLGWASVLQGFDTKSDNWSPSQDNSQAVPVSMERVTARTLQTIPFSEDPFWKEIEELTMFDPSNMGGHLGAPKGQNTSGSVPELDRSAHEVDMATSHSSTLHKNPRNGVMSISERMQRSKSLYTPNLTPLTVNVNEKSSSSAVSALDEVLEDISRSSMERKQLSPKKRSLEADSTTSASSRVQSYLRAKQDAPRHNFKFEGGQFTFIKPADVQPQSVKQNEVGRPVHGSSDQQTVQMKQPLQFYQQQRQQQKSQNRQSEIFPAGMPSYHLDPDLLKQKLLSTGLVVETDTEEPVCLKQTRSSSLGSQVDNYCPTTMLQQPGNSHFRDLVQSLSSQTSTRPTTSELSASQATRSSALEDIQKALSPFQPTSYQPGPETLYGTSKFQSFNEPKFDTSRGPNTKPTSWTYQPQLNKRNESAYNNETFSTNSLSRLQRVNASMDELKNLAQNVEKKINEIKGKLQMADEKSLDTILASLKKLTPEVKSGDSERGSFEDYYASKKSKLSDALAELDRIYKGLDLQSDELPAAGQGGKYGFNKPSEIIFLAQSSSPHLQAAQTRISSVYIPGLEIKSKVDLDKETESEFDVISKSFQAIVDEVNQTTSLFSQAAEKHVQENMAPEMQKVASRIMLKSGDPTKAGIVSKTSGTNTAASTTATAPKSQEIKPKTNRFRSKFQDNITVEEECNLKKTRSKSVPGLDTNTVELQEGTAATTVISKAEVSTDERLTTSAMSSSSPSVRQRSRVRPVRDNKIMQDDRAAKFNAPGSAPSPQPSPQVSRKIIYNNSLSSDIKLHQSQDVHEEGKTSRLQQPGANQHIQTVQDSAGDTVSSPAFIASPASQKKVPPPTAAKPGARPEAATPVSTPSAKVTPLTLTSKVHLATPVSASKPGNTEPSSTRKNQEAYVATTTNIRLVPPTSENNQAKPTISETKLDEPDCSATSGGQRTRRRIGAGVAMILEKLNTEDDAADKLKKRYDTQSAPDLTGTLNKDNEDDCCGQDHGCRKSAGAGKVQIKVAENKDGANLRSPTQKCVDKRVAGLTSEASKMPWSKSTVVSRKVIDLDSRTSDSATSSPQPSSPVIRPPQHPWKRQLSDSCDIVMEPAVSSPKFVSKIPRPVTSVKSMASSVTPEEFSNPCDNGYLHQVSGNSRPVTRRIRPPDRKIQTETIRSRPHSFHELISCFEVEHQKLQRSERFRKYASADQVNPEVLVQKVFRSERSHNAGNGLQVTRDKTGAVLKLQMVIKS